MDGAHLRLRGKSPKVMGRLRWEDLSRRLGMVYYWNSRLRDHDIG